MVQIIVVVIIVLFIGLFAMLSLPIADDELLSDAAIAPSSAEGQPKA